MLNILLDKAQKLKAELDAMRPLSPDAEGRVMQKLRIDWNFHSNNMEGNSLTYGETKALLLFGVTTQGKPLDDHRQIAGHEEAIDWLLNILAKKEDISEHFIRNLHELILEKPYQVDAQTPDGKPTKRWIKIGEYKTTPNHVKTKTGKLFYFATPEETPAKMHDLMDSYRKNAASEDINPILLAAAFHYEFVRIHPFDDGNGRMSRLLMNFILMRFGYPPTVIKTEDKHNYLAALERCDANDSYTSLPLAEYLSSAVIHSLELMLKGARGESIEEPSDLDKLLAMFDKQLSEINQRTRTFDVLENFGKNTLKNIIAELGKITEKFKHYYSKRAYSFFLNNYGVDDNDSITMTNSIKDLHFLLKDIPDYHDFDLCPSKTDSFDFISFSDDIIERFLFNIPQYIENSDILSWKFTLTCDYQNFDNLGLGIYKPFDYNLSVDIQLEKTYYSIKSKNAELSKLYHEPLTEDELANFFTKEGNAHFAYIQQQIKEQQKSL